MDKGETVQLSSLRCVQTACKEFTHLLGTTPQYDLINVNVSMLQFMCEDKALYFKWLPNISKLLGELYQLILDTQVEEMTEFKYHLLKNRLHVKLVHFPFTKSLYRSLDSITEETIGKWIIVEGKIIRAMKKTLEKSKLYKCSACGYIERCYCTYHNNYNYQPSKSCPGMVDKVKTQNMFVKLFKKMSRNRNQTKKLSPSKEQPEEVKTKLGRCGNRKFEPVDDNEVADNKIFVTYQQLKIQEPFKHITTRGRIPHTMTVVLEGLFNEEYRPGDDVTVSGLLTYSIYKMSKGSKIDEELIIVANNIILKKLHKDKYQQEDDDETILSSLTMDNSVYLAQSDDHVENQILKRNHIISLFCPNIFQRDHIKLAILLCVLGGVNQTIGTTKIRGQSHLLLVGEPGTGKSVLLKAAAQITQRSFLTNGISSSTAGLTVSHVNCRGQWMIEAGALVLADNGVCCIDQLNLLATKEQESLLQAMEQQTISSAKAGIIGKLNCRTTVLAACNPVRPGQKYDNSLSVSVNTGLIVPLITRFDLVMILSDQPNVVEDSDKCDHLLSRFLRKNDLYGQSKQLKKQLLTLKTILRRARSFEPRIMQQQMLTNYFVKIRQNTSEKTVRALESLCRLAEAHAKLMFRQETTPFDCMSVIMLMEGVCSSSLQQFKQHQMNLQTKINR